MCAGWVTTKKATPTITSMLMIRMGNIFRIVAIIPDPTVDCKM